VPKVRMTVFCTAYIIKMGLTAMLCVNFMLYGLSLVYLGFGSYNQVLFGFTIALVFSAVGHYNIKPLFLDSWDQFVQDDRLSYKSISCKTHLKYFFFALVLPLCLSALVHKMCFSAENYSHWEQVIYAKCNSTEVGPILYDHDFYLGLKIAAIYGIFTGQYSEW